MVDVAKFYQNLNLLVDDVISSGITVAPAPLVLKDVKKQPSVVNKDIKEEGKTDVPVHSWRDVSAGDMQKHIVNLSLGLSGTSEKVHNYLKIVTFVLMRDFPGETVRITSGKRSPDKQVSIMEKNWRASGGNKPLKKPVKIRGVEVKTMGELDTVKIYGARIGMAFNKYMSTGTPSRKDWLRYYKNKKGSRHLSGNAIDFQSRDKPFMTSLFQGTRDYADISVIDETRRAGPHWHVSVNSITAPKVSNLDFPIIKKPLILNEERLLANLKVAGLNEEVKCLRSISYIVPTLEFHDVAQSILRIIYHFAQAVEPDNHRSYLQNMESNLLNIDQLELGTRNKNPGAGIGGTVSLIKNILSGQDTSFVNAVITEIVQGLSQL